MEKAHSPPTSWPERLVLLPGNYQRIESRISGTDISVGPVRMEDFIVKCGNSIQRLWKQ